MTDETTQILPDTKDWTWVVDRACPECGESVGTLALADIPGAILDTVPRWRAALAAPGVRSRPEPTTWSPLEYGAHVRDVHEVFHARLRLMLAEDGARFANWDQDEAALEGRYGELEPAVVAEELSRRAEALAADVAAISPAAETRRGLRSNGSEFTVLSLLQYYLHDSLHHLHDVGA